MNALRSEDLFVGVIALALLPLIGWRIVRGLRDGDLALYRTHVSRDDGARFKVLLLLHALSFLIVAAISADLLFNLGMRSAL